MPTLLHAAAALRPARLDDTDPASELLSQALPWLGPMCGLNQEARVQTLLHCLFAGAGNRLSFRYARVAQAETRPAGLILTCPAARAPGLALRTLWAAARANGWPGLPRLLGGLRAFSRMHVCQGDEFHIAAWAVLPEYRGLGIGGQLLRYAERRAAECRLNKVSLVVEQHNGHALEMLRGMDYREVAVTRAAHFAFYHLVKTLG